MYSRKFHGWFKHLDFIIFDIVFFELAFFVAYAIRHDVNFFVILINAFIPGKPAFHTELYRNYSIGIIPAALVADFLIQAHSGILRRGYLKELEAVIKLTVVTVLEMIISLFVLQQSFIISRLVVGYFFIFSNVLLYLYRIFYKKLVLKLISRNSFNTRKILIYTCRDFAKDALQRFSDNNLGDVEIAGVISYDDHYNVGDDIYISDGRSYKVLAVGQNIIEYLRHSWVDEIVFLPDELHKTERNELIDMCSVMGITTHIVLSVEDDKKGRRTVEDFLGATVITESLNIANPTSIVLKRVADIVFSIIGLAVTGVLMIIVVPGIMINDPGPIFFKQKRVGKNGRIFKLYKFRSMYRDAENRKADLMAKNQMQGNMFKLDTDPRIIGSGPDGTRHGFGWFIRKTSIDEFPQFINVLRGEMSLVGTRPPTLDEWERYEAHHRARMAIRPGITGMWQVSGRNRITDFEDVIRLDMEYIETWSIELDIKIILKTIVELFKGGGE